MNSFLQDLRFTLRSLRRRPVFAAVAIITMALGIGATTAIYSIVDGVLLRPLPFRDTGRLVQIREIFYDWKGNPVFGSMWDRIPLAVDEFETVRDKGTSFSSVGMWSGASLTLNESGSAREELRGAKTSASLLGVLGAQVVRGRDFNRGEDVVGGPKLAMIGYEYWQRKYGGRDDAVGKFIADDDASYEIIGVLPKGLTLNPANAPLDFWTLAGQDSSDRFHNNRSFSTVARLSPAFRSSARRRKRTSCSRRRSNKGAWVRGSWTGRWNRRVMCGRRYSCCSAPSHCCS
jgi:hypothetical protein